MLAAKDIISHTIEIWHGCDGDIPKSLCRPILKAEGNITLLTKDMYFGIVTVENMSFTFYNFLYKMV